MGLCWRLLSDKGNWLVPFISYEPRDRGTLGNTAREHKLRRGYLECGWHPLTSRCLTGAWNCEGPSPAHSLRPPHLSLRLMVPIMVHIITENVGGLDQAVNCAWHELHSAVVNPPSLAADARGMFWYVPCPGQRMVKDGFVFLEGFASRYGWEEMPRRPQWHDASCLALAESVVLLVVAHAGCLLQGPSLEQT